MLTPSVGKLIAPKAFAQASFYRQGWRIGQGVENLARSRSLSGDRTKFRHPH
ncbi:MAG: hypothetical protein KME42_25240 [Tildeniella nuda ZEHNDER 1965/U140]|nr:hypothetical protein [Tildeniella nuda ZEHNDER 1965/U140]